MEDKETSLPCCSSLCERPDRLKGHAASFPLTSVENQRLTFDWSNNANSQKDTSFLSAYQAEIICPFSKIYPVLINLCKRFMCHQLVSDKQLLYHWR